MNGYFAATKLSLQCNVVRAAKIGTVPCERLRRHENGSRVHYPILRDRRRNPACRRGAAEPAGDVHVPDTIFCSAVKRASSRALFTDGPAVDISLSSIKMYGDMPGDMPYASMRYSAVLVRRIHRTLLAAKEMTVDKLTNLLNSMPWYAWVAIVAIIASAVVRIAKMNHDKS